MRKRRFTILLWGAIFGLFGLAMLDLWVGPIKFSGSQLAAAFIGNDSDSMVYKIFWDIRFPKMLTTVMAGAGLALGGHLTQTLFRNPLAGPDVLGLTSGASLFVALLILGGLGTGGWSVALAASAGAAAVFLTVLALSRKIPGNNGLLIVGLMMSALVSSVVAILQYISSVEALKIFTIWTLGNVSSTQGQDLWILAAGLLITCILAYTIIRQANAWMLGDAYLTTMGLHTGSFRWKVLLATCLIVGTVTAFCGPIAFVGIAVPHLVKRLLPTFEHQKLIPLSLMLGASLLLACDILGSIGPAIPINALTALFGAPVIIAIVLQSKTDFA